MVRVLPNPRRRRPIDKRRAGQFHEDVRVRSRRIALVAVLLTCVGALGACGNEDEAAPSRAAGGASTTPSTTFEQRTHDVWETGDDARDSVTKVTGVLRGGDPQACISIEVEGVGHPVTWPPGSTRTDEGITVGEHLYRFDQEATFSVIQDYEGPQRLVSCVTVRAWLVTQ